jgi:hypothetical protein
MCMSWNIKEIIEATCTVENLIDIFVRTTGCNTAKSPYTVNERIALFCSETGA